MTTKRAKILDDRQLNRVLAWIDAHSDLPEADRLKILLSHRAGMRACEIANLTLDAVTTADGRISKVITIFGNTTKYGRGRIIPMHPEIADAIRAFKKAHPDVDYFAVGALVPRLSVTALTVWFHRIYRRVGLEGCSSHSGRRSFITQMAKLLPGTGGTLRDVQLIAGHARLDTTESYIEPSNKSAAIVSMLGQRKFAHLHNSDFDSHRRHISELSDQLSTPVRKRTHTRNSASSSKASPTRGRRGSTSK